MSLAATQVEKWLISDREELEGTRPLEDEGGHCLEEQETVVAEACFFQFGESLATSMPGLLVRGLDISLANVMLESTTVILDFIRIVLG